MKITWKLYTVLGILLFVINIILFAVPFRKTLTFWLSDIFIIFAILSQVFVTKVAYSNAKTVKSKFYGFPITFIGMIYFFVITVCAMILIICSSLIEYFPNWISVIIYFIVTGAAGVGLIAADSTRNYVEHQEVNLQENTAFIKKLTAEALALKNGNINPEMQAILDKLYEEIRFTDPVSSSELVEYENQLYQSFEVIKQAVVYKDIEKVYAMYDKFHQQLILRNSLCKSTKD